MATRRRAEILASSWVSIGSALAILGVGLAAACTADFGEPVHAADKTDEAEPTSDGGERPNGPRPVSVGDGGETPPIDAGPYAVATRIRSTGYYERCKLITNRHQNDETENHTHSLYNLRGTDLGIPVAHDSDLYFFFGDSAGARNIWPLGPESLPDAVGYSGVGLAAALDDPSTLCRNLKFLLIGGTKDFAVNAMTPPPGRRISDFVRNPAGPRGKNAFPSFPGDFEVPSGAFSYNGAIYVFYTIINHNPFEMRGSYLAKWAAPSTSGLPTYQILHDVDQRFDANGPMRGDFINIAPVVHGEYLYLYGTGQYRKSSVSLARKRLTQIEQAGGYERFDPASKTWIPANQQSAPLIATPAGGEFSVVYFPELRKFVTLDSELGFILARFADAPEGPWSEPVTAVSMVDPAFAAKYCCFDIFNPTNDNAPCIGEQLLHCTKAGLYGTYLLPKAKVNADNSFELTFTVSTWDPYSVALMSAKFVRE